MHDPDAFIRANTVIAALPSVPEISLHLADEVTDLWNKTETDLESLGLPPPFWAFAWVGGQGIARYLLDHPARIAGHKVLDFACGSGLVGIAAMKAGALRVEAVDIDPFAIAATMLNATLNGVTIHATREDVIGTDQGWDIILAGDVFYERDMVARVTPWLAALAARGALVLIGDPRRSFLPSVHLTELAAYDIATTRAIEDSDTKRSFVFRVDNPENSADPG